jgi:hypothetical protein
MQKLYLYVSLILLFPFSLEGKDFYQLEQTWPNSERNFYLNTPARISIDDRNYIYIYDRKDIIIYKFSRNGFLISSIALKNKLKDINYSSYVDLFTINDRLYFITKSNIFYFNNSLEIVKYIDAPCHVLSVISDDFNIYLDCEYENIITLNQSLDIVKKEIIESDGNLIAKVDNKYIFHNKYYPTYGKLTSVDLLSGKSSDFLDLNNDKTGNSIRSVFVYDDVFYLLYIDNFSDNNKDNYFLIYDYYKKTKKIFTLEKNTMSNLDQYTDMTVDKNNIYISDELFDRVTIFDKKTLDIKDVWSGYDKLDDYSDIFILNNENIVLLNSSSDTVTIHSKYGTLLNSHSINDPISIHQDHNKNFHILNDSGKKITKYDENFNVIKQFSTSSIKSCTHNGNIFEPGDYDINITNGFIYTINSYLNICKLSLDYKLIESSNAILTSLSTNIGHSSTNGENIFIPINNSIMKIDSNLQFIKFIENIEKPTDVEVVGETLLVIESDKSVIKIFNNNGELIDKIGSFGSLPNQFKRPKSMAFKKNRLYISDTENKRITVYKKLDRPNKSKAIVIIGGQ